MIHIRVLNGLQHHRHAPQRPVPGVIMRISRGVGRFGHVAGPSAQPLHILPGNAIRPEFSRIGEQGIQCQIRRLQTDHLAPLRRGRLHQPLQQTEIRLVPTAVMTFVDQRHDTHVEFRDARIDAGERRLFERFGLRGIAHPWRGRANPRHA